MTSWEETTPSQQPGPGRHHLLVEQQADIVFESSSQAVTCARCQRELERQCSIKLPYSQLTPYQCSACQQVPRPRSVDCRPFARLSREKQRVTCVSNVRISLLSAVSVQHCSLHISSQSHASLLSTGKLCIAPCVMWVCCQQGGQAE